MTPIKKWICMLAFLIMLAITCEGCYAKTYISDDSSNLSSTYHDIFNNYFSETQKYTYFPYRSNNRVCYYGIDEDFNYLDICYINSTSSTLIYTKGTDKNFSVSGVNVFVHEPSSDSVILYILGFAFVLFIILQLLEDL